MDLESRQDIEKAIIGGWLLSPKQLIDDAELGVVSAGWFEDKVWRACAKELLAKGRKGESLDVLTLRPILVSKKVLSEKQAGKILIDAQSFCPASYKVPQYVDTLKGFLTAEKANRVGQRLSENSIGLGEAQQQLEEIEKFSAQAKMVTIEKAVDMLMSDAEAGKVERSFRCMPGIDHILKGLVDTRLYILAARPGVGKTSYALQMTRGLLAGGKPVLFVSLEMEERELVKRMISADCSVPSYRVDELIAKGDENVCLRASELMGEDLFIIDDPLAGFGDIRKAFFEILERCGVKPVIVVDYLQLLSARQGRFKSRYEEVTWISRQLKVMAKKLDTSVVCLSQLNRNIEGRSGSKGAWLSDLRDSGSIEQDADVVVLMWRDDLGDVVVDVAKNRHGGTGEVVLGFVGEFTKFIVKT